MSYNKIKVETGLEHLLIQRIIQAKLSHLFKKGVIIKLKLLNI
jgi:hypothetical protein